MFGEFQNCRTLADVAKELRKCDGTAIYDDDFFGIFREQLKDYEKAVRCYVREHIELRRTIEKNKLDIIFDEAAFALARADENALGNEKTRREIIIALGMMLTETWNPLNDMGCMFIYDKRKHLTILPPGSDCPYCHPDPPEIRTYIPLNYCPNCGRPL